MLVQDVVIPGDGGHLLRLPLSYFEARHPGDVATRLESVDQVRKVVTTAVVAAAVDAIMILLSGLIMFLYAPLLAMIVSSITPSGTAVFAG